jgi:hypothetical protein
MLLVCRGEELYTYIAHRAPPLNPQTFFRRVLSRVDQALDIGRPWEQQRKGEWPIGIVRLQDVSGQLCGIFTVDHSPGKGKFTPGSRLTGRQH